VRTRIGVLTLTSVLLMSGCGSFRSGQTSPDALLLRGEDEYRTEHYAEAVEDLKAAAEGFLSPDVKQKYLDTGHLEPLPRFETALVYLTMAYSKLGREQDAHDAVMRLAAAERIEPVYATLPLGSDVIDFENLATTRSPANALAANAALAQLRSGATSPAVPPHAPLGSAATPATEREAMLRMIEEGSVTLRAQYEQEAQQRLAAERAAAQKAAEERVAAERAAAERAAERRAAEEREAAQRAAEAQRATTERSVQQTIAVSEAEARSNQLTRLRQAQAAVNAGRLEDANDLYISAANAPGASREAIAAAATGLYRTGDYGHAVEAFRKLGTFHRGEEDLRYYNAVSLYETGHYEQAKKELACALPYIQITRDVSRYRTKIEKMR
jgi:hypothetical protein